MVSPPSFEDVGPYYAWGDIARFKRCHSRGFPAVVNLNNSLHESQRLGPLVEFLTSEKGVEKLLLRGNSLRDQDISMLMDCLTREAVSVRHLDLSDNALLEGGVAALLHMIENREPGKCDEPRKAALSELNLSGNRIGAKGVAILAGSVRSKSQQLKILDLSRCGLRKASAKPILELLVGTRTLEELFLGWNSFGFKGARTIAKGMEVNMSVKKLDLQWAGISDKGASTIAHMLEINRSLRVLDISGNGVGSETCTVLKDMLIQHGVLDELALRNSPLGSYGACLLLQGVKIGTRCCNYVDLRGCSFLGIHDPPSSRTFHLKQPNGGYQLDLSSLADKSVASQLFALRKTHGPTSWQEVSLDGEYLDDKALDKWSLPSHGKLVLKFVSTRRPSPEDRPLQENELENCWMRPTTDESHSDADHPPTDMWKLELLRVLCSDFFFKSSQAKQVLQRFGGASEKVQAAIMVLSKIQRLGYFGQCLNLTMRNFQTKRSECRTRISIFSRLVDPEMFHVVIEDLHLACRDEIYSGLGILSLFHPENPTGRYKLILGHQAHYMIASRLLTFFRSQFDSRLCDLPNITCVPHFNLNGKQAFIEDPHSVSLPRYGELEVDFCDLRPIPSTAKVMGKHHFEVLLSHLKNDEAIDHVKLMGDMEDDSVSTAMRVVSTLAQTDTKRPKRSQIQNLEYVLKSLKTVVIRNYFKCWQIREILLLIPTRFQAERIEIATSFWGRAVDRRKNWSFMVLQTLKPPEQIKVCQILGYLNTFDYQHPELSYQIRMNRPDEHKVAYRLFKMTQSAEHTCVKNMRIDGKPYRVTESSGLWAAMRGYAPEGVIPTATLEFDFIWPDSEKIHWAVCLVQAAYHAMVARKTFQRNAKKGQ
ncbi:hypothetical protein BSKO_10813 [Bryopsis sp. KO-2023]|nr:hypothetical protein BSKO_10813 [Bryopsis sp. KO-2023]